jgi:hypothetical protein
MSGDAGWEEIFEEYDLAWAILPVDEISVHLIQVDLGWEEVYRDETAVILHR